MSTKLVVLRKVVKVESDSKVLVRESPAAKVRERWAENRLLVHQMTLERDLSLAHLSENIDHSLEPVPYQAPKLSWWEAAQDKIRVYLCIHLHAKPSYRRGDQFYTCPACSRKYALPWADMSKVETDVYVPAKPFLTPAEPIRQALCMNGTSGVS